MHFGMINVLFCFNNVFKFGTELSLYWDSFFSFSTSVKLLFILFSNWLAFCNATWNIIEYFFCFSTDFFFFFDTIFFFTTDSIKILLLVVISSTLSNFSSSIYLISSLSFIKSSSRFVLFLFWSKLWSLSSMNVLKDISLSVFSDSNIYDIALNYKGSFYLSSSSNWTVLNDLSSFYSSCFE